MCVRYFSYVVVAIQATVSSTYYYHNVFYQHDVWLSVVLQNATSMSVL